MEFSLFVPTKIHFGTSSLETLVGALEAAGFNKIGLVYDHNLAEHDLLKELQENLNSFAELISEPITFAEPTYRNLDSYRDAFMGSGIQAVVGVGGGSALDTAKAIAVLVNNKEPAIAYRGFDKMTEPVLPIYAVPTTAGTGSEITPNASFVDDEAMKKLGINGEAIRPLGAYLHPGFIVTCPEKPATYAAIDALVHAVEAFAAQKATPMAQMFAREAVHLVLNNVVDADQKKEMVSIEKVFMGSLLAGIAMMHSGTGPAAAFSYPLGVHLKVPHGLAGGIFLPHIVQWNIDKGYYGYANLLPFENFHGTEAEKASKFVLKISSVWKKLGIPASIKKIGFDESTMMELFLEDLQELRGAIDQNPVFMDERDYKKILSM